VRWRAAARRDGWCSVPRPDVYFLHPQHGLNPFLPPSELRFVVNVPKRLERQPAFANVVEAPASGLAQSVQGMPLVECEDLSIGIAEPLSYKQSQAYGLARAGWTDKKGVPNVVVVQVQAVRHTALCGRVEQRRRIRRHERRGILPLARPHRRDRHQVNIVARVRDDAAHLRHAVPRQCAEECIDCIDVFDPNAESAIDEYLAEFADDVFQELPVLVLEHNGGRQMAEMHVARSCFRQRAVRVRDHGHGELIQLAAAARLEDLIL
jgi:hypothetical protein